MKNLAAVRMTRDRFVIEKGAHETNVLILVMSGSFSVVTSGEKLTVRQHEAMFFRAGEPFVRQVIEPMELLYITFEDGGGEVIPRGHCRLQLPPHRMVQNLELLQQEPRTLEHVVVDLFWHHFCLVREPKVTPADQILFFMKENLHRELRMTELAKRFYLSPSGLIYVVRQATGKTPGECLADFRIEEAQRLLLDETLPIAEIARLCGFQNQYYFSNVFKKKKGMSPTAYRRQYLV